MEAHSTLLRVSSPEFLFNIHKSFHFCKVESVLMSYSCTLQDIIIFHGNPTTPIPKSGVAILPTSPGLMPVPSPVVASRARAGRRAKEVASGGKFEHRPRFSKAQLCVCFLE